MELNGTNFKQKLSNKFCCEICNYNTSRKSNMDSHFKSAKHQKELNGTNFKQKLSNNILTCEICNKTYQTSAGLWKHKAKGICNIKNTNSEMGSAEDSDIIQTNEIHELKEFMKYLMKENTDMKTMMMEVIKNGTNHITNTHTNSHNKAFNLNFFLNETCKDAMNIMDFVESIQLQLSDLEKVGELGYVEGISNIIVKNLNELDVTQRPVHCTDKKRETIYIKDENKWEKDDEKNKIRKMIKRVASKNQRLLLKFKEMHPDCIKYHSKYSDQYNKLIVESMGGSGNNDVEKEDKIIRNIVKNVVVDKSTESS
jgi:hypothetical protein